VAIFTNKQDRALPLLTQFYQLDTAKDTYPPEIEKAFELRLSDEQLIAAFGEYQNQIPHEVDRFLYLFAEGFSDESFSTEKLWSEEHGVYTDPDTDPSEGWREAVTSFHAAVAHLMDALARRPRIATDGDTETTLQSIEIVNRRMLAPQIGLDDPLRLRVFYAPDESEEGLNDFDRLAAVIGLSLSECVAGRSTLIVCQECFSPFVSNRKGHSYCSYRCASRVGQRERRKKRQGEQ
jgi:hypothetical protein